MAVDLVKIEQATKLLLEAIGEDVDREGLEGTPRRVAGFWQEFIEYKPGNLDVTFSNLETDQMVVVSGIKVWSMCEHHLLPFWAEISIGYIAYSKVLGLSKIARVAQKYAHSLQIQERLVNQIADEIQQLTGSEDIAVISKGEHLCCTMRGIKTPSIMKPSIMRGAFKEIGPARSEFFELVKW